MLRLRVLVGSLLLCALSFYQSIRSLVVVVPRESQNSPTKLIILHYHKTGHDLSSILAMAGFHRHVRRYKPPKKKLAHVIADQQNMSDVALVDGIELYSDWKGWLLPTTRLAHFVRDPFDWCLSAYLYHRQVPIPILERKWMNKTDKDRCIVRDEEFAQKELSIELEPVSNLCLSFSNETALHPQLQVLSFADGLRLEATRGLLGSRHGDLMRMAHHAWLSLRVVPPHKNNVQTFLLSQFTSTPSSFQQASRRLCQFGQSDDVTDCVQESLQRGYLGNSSSSNHQHVTSHHLTKDEKRAYKMMLRNDPVLGPPLTKIQSLIQEAWSRDWGAPVLQ